MQWLDYWIGIPLCAIISAINLLGGLFSKRDLPAPKRILFLELSEMGSGIIAHSAISRAQVQHDAEIYFLVFERNRPGVELMSEIKPQNIIGISDKGFLDFSFGLLLALFRIRKEKIDTVIDMELFSRCSALISWLTGAKNRVGFCNGLSEGLYRGNFLTHNVFYNHHQHMSLNFLALVESLNEDINAVPLLKRDVREFLLPPPQLSISEEEKNEAWSIISQSNSAVGRNNRLLIFNPDPGLLALRGWPIERFGLLAKKLCEKYPDTAIVVVGLERSKTVSSRFTEYVPANRLVDLCGKTKTLRSLLSVISIASILVTNDSGPAHMVTLTNVKSFVLFGPETPALYGPLGNNSCSIYAGLSCSPCYAASNHRRSSCSDNQCLKIISVDQVFSIIAPSLG